MNEKNKLLCFNFHSLNTRVCNLSYLDIYFKYTYRLKSDCIDELFCYICHTHHCFNVYM